MKNEKSKKRRNSDNKILYPYFSYMEIDLFCSKHSFGKCSLYYYIFSKVFFSVAGYVK